MTAPGSPTASGEVLLEARGLRVGRPASRRSPALPLVRGVDLLLRRGEVLGLAGESGAGKSLTALALLGLCPPGLEATGSVRLSGRELVGLPVRDLARLRGRHIAMVFQDALAAFTPVHRIGDQIGEALRIHQRPRPGRESARRAAAELLDAVGVPEPGRVAGAYPHQLSGGTRQRAMIAMAMANRPDVIVADEPTSALDVTVQAQVLQALVTARRETGAALLLISHDLGVLAGTADRVAVMYGGRVVEYGSTRELFARPRMPYTAGLIGSVPRLDRDVLPTPMPGAPPAPGGRGPGCTFAPRCPLAEPECRTHEPELTGDEGDPAGGQEHPAAAEGPLASGDGHLADQEPWVPVDEQPSTDRERQPTPDERCPSDHRQPSAGGAMDLADQEPWEPVDERPSTDRERQPTPDERCPSDHRQPSAGGAMDLADPERRLRTDEQHSAHHQRPSPPDDPHLAACRRSAEAVRLGAAALFPPSVPVRAAGARGVVEPVLRIRGLVKAFPVAGGGGRRRRGRREVRVLEGVDLEVRRGETLGLVGESGCGKSTTLLEVISLKAPRQGTIEVLGQDTGTLSRDAERRLRGALQIVFQDPMASLDPRMTVGDIVAEPLLVQRAPAERIAARVAEVLRLVGLSPDDAAALPHRYSGGQRQRIAIARALAVEPRLLLLDEPVSALDVSVRAGILDLLRRLKEDPGPSCLFVSHDLAMVRQIADRVAVMYAGRVVETGTVDEVFGQPCHPYTKALLDAVPVPDPAVARVRSATVLRGDPPAAGDSGTGCRFRPRCPVFESLEPSQRSHCEREFPAVAMTSTDGGRSVVCHFPLTGG